MVSWDVHFMEMATLIATRSKDPNRKVGAVIVDECRRAIGSGYNGFPRGVRDDPDRYENKLVKLKLIVHAEANAILNSNGGRKYALFCTSYPCSECAKLIIQSGISRVVSPRVRDGSAWKEDAEFTAQMFDECGVEHVEAK